MRISTSIATVALFAGMLVAVQPGAAQSGGFQFEPRFTAGAFGGFQSGLAGQVFVEVEEFAQGFPLKVRLRVGYTATEPGDPLAARRVFINDATNGTPEEAGRTLDFGLDGLYPFREGILLYGGVRHSRFRANFNFIGGNEDFDITSSHWGLAAGAEAFFPMGSRAQLLVSGGVEYMFPARLSGHDTSYSPDGDNVNPRNDYTYDTADDAVGQPVLRPVLLIGVGYRLGGR